MISIVVGGLGAATLLTEYLAFIKVVVMTRKSDSTQQTAVLDVLFISAEWY